MNALALLAGVAAPAPAISTRSNTYEHDNEGANDAAEGDAVLERPRKRTKRETSGTLAAEESNNASLKKTNKKNVSTSNANKQTRRPSAKKKGSNVEDESMDVQQVDDDGDGEYEFEVEDQTQSDEYDHGPLTAITAKKYGRTFTGSVAEKKQSQERPSLPLILIHTICDFLPDRSLFSLARVSRSSYAMVREYGESVVLAESKRSVTSDPLGDEIEFMSSAAGSVNPHPQHRLGQRSIKVSDVFDLSPLLSKLLHSQLRHMLTSISLSICGLEAVATVSQALPYLRVLILAGLKAKRTKEVCFPPYLRSLSANFELAPATLNVREKYMIEVSTAVGQLKYLNEFRITNRLPSVPSSAPWISLIAGAPRLRFLSSAVSDLISSPEMLHQFSSSFISLRQRGDIKSCQLPIYRSLKGLRLNLQNLNLCPLMKEEFIDSLAPFASTLTSLTPANWMTSKVTWLSTFTQLRALTINTSSDRHCPDANEDFQPIWKSTECVTLIMSEVVDTLCQLTHLKKLQLSMHRLENDQLERILKSLTSLQHLRIGSPEVTSISYFQRLPHLVNQLDTLILRLPNLPRDEVVHLYSLRWLSHLDIADSFAEPLYLPQLMPLQSPSQRQPYLITFTPRGKNEPIPVQPISSEKQALAVHEFNIRVRLGQVCAAEMVNSDQLSLILQQLDCKEFSFAARTCRSWRAAASLKNAWSSGNTGRILIIEGDAPECVPSILPLLPLWRYARRVKFYLDRYPLYHPGMDRLTFRESVSEPVATVAALTRLESLELQCPHRPYSNSDSQLLQPLISFLSQVESRVIFFCLTSYFTNIWPALNQPFSRLQTLDLNLAALHDKHSYNWSAMTQLHTIKLNQLPNGCGDALRRLSLEHQLRSVSLNLSVNLVDHPTYLLAHFMDHLTHQVGTDGKATTTRQPAAITQFHVTLSGQPTLAPLDSVFDLQHLTDLRIEVKPPRPQDVEDPTTILAPLTPWNFSQIAKKNAFQQLERFFYSGPIDPTQLTHLAHMKQLRSFGLADSWYLHFTGKEAAVRCWSRANEHTIPAGCIAQWIRSFAQLEEFHLAGVQIIGSELQELTFAKCLWHFRLQHVSTTPLSADDFTFLSSCAKLESVELRCVLGLTLTPRHTWFDGASPALVQHDQDGDIEMKSGVATAASSSSTSSSSLIATLRACSLLKQLTWFLHPTEHDASFAFTDQHARIGRSSIWDRRMREWTRERYTLKSRLRPHSSVAAEVSSSTTAASSSVSISYTPCHETLEKRYPNGQIDCLLIVQQEQKFFVSSALPIDGKDPDLIAHQNEIQRVLEKTPPTLQSKAIGKATKKWKAKR